MNRRSLAAGSVLLVLVSCNATEGDPKAAEKEIREQVGRYTAALDAADTNLASQVWDTAPDVSFIHPGGHAHGWEEVKGIYQFFGSAFSDRKLVARDIAVHVNGNTAWVEFYWHYSAKQTKDGGKHRNRRTGIASVPEDRGGMAHGARALFGPSDGVPIGPTRELSCP